MVLAIWVLAGPSDDGAECKAERATREQPVALRVNAWRFGAGILPPSSRPGVEVEVEEVRAGQAGLFGQPYLRFSCLPDA